MLAYIQTLPEAAAWPRFPAWFHLLETGDRQGMLEMLRAFSPEERANVLFFLRAMNALGRQAQIWLQNDRRHTAPTSGQDDVLAICRFLCYERSDIRNQWRDLEYALPAGPVILDLLRARKPEWFAEVYLHHLQGHGFDYRTGIACERAGSPVFTPAATANRLSALLFTARNRCGDMQALYSEYPEIFDRDIWTLFSEKAYSLGGQPIATEDYRKRARALLDEWRGSPNPPEEPADRIRELLGRPELEPYPFLAMVVADGIEAGKLERGRVMRECLIGICRNLEKDQPSGFSDLFTALAPTVPELLDLQDELAAVLGCPHSKPVTAALKWMKTIAARPGFNHEAFAAALPPLSCSTVKAVRAAALAVAEELAKKTPEARPGLMRALAPIFSVPDAATQVRAAKLLATYAAPDDAPLREAVATWRDSITAAAGELLAGFFEAPDAPGGVSKPPRAGLRGTDASPSPGPGAIRVAGAEQSGPTRDSQPQPFVSVFARSWRVWAEPTSEPDRLQQNGHCNNGPRRLDESMRVSVPQTLDDCLFMLAEAFGNPAEYHCSLVPDALFAVRDQLDDASLSRLGPAIAAARKVVCNCNTTLRVHSRTPALHFLRYCVERLEAAPDKGLAALKRKLPAIAMECSSTFVIFEWDNYYKKYRTLSYPPLYTAFYGLNAVVEAAFARLRTGDGLPMLSSVTHAPCWVDPLELITRLLAWQDADREPHGMDMQLALQRCCRENSAEALAAAKALKGECRALLEYFLGPDNTVPAVPDRHGAWWVAAALARPERRVPPELAGPEYADIPPQYFGSPFDWEILPLQTNGPNSEKEFATTSTQRVAVSLPGQKTAPYYLWFDEVKENGPPGGWRELFGGRMFLAEDVSLLHQALMLYPNNPEPLVMDIIAGYGREKYWKALAVFAKLLELRAPQGPAADLFLALGLLTGAKEPRLHAAAYWRAKVEEGAINSADTGRMLGRLERHNWVPTKRFTDLAEREMMGISPRHSAQLALMLEALLIEIGPEPPVNIKRILELYYELTAAQGRSMDAALPPLLDAWAREKPYAACVKKLRGLGLF